MNVAERKSADAGSSKVKEETDTDEQQQSTDSDSEDEKADENWGREAAKNPQECRLSRCFGFLVFFQAERERMRKNHPEKSMIEINKELPMKWKRLNAEQRRPYKIEAKRVCELSEEDYIEYRDAGPYPITKKSKESITTPEKEGSVRRS